MADWKHARELALAAILPSDQPRYIALLSGPTEITSDGYARVEFSDWETTHGDGQSTRSNASPVVFGPINSAAIFNSWAIYDAAVGGNELRSGPVVDAMGHGLEVDLDGVGDTVKFPIGALQIKFVDDLGG